ncbi:Uncharacterised protein [Vibrio cholerae]|nr:Uncharacterised protein [Vibrio cholerae]
MIEHITGIVLTFRIEQNQAISFSVIDAAMGGLVTILISDVEREDKIWL